MNKTWFTVATLITSLSVFFAAPTTYAAEHIQTKNTPCHTCKQCHAGHTCDKCQQTSKTKKNNNTCEHDDKK